MKNLTMSAWVVALFVLPSIPAFAQQASSGATNSSAGAPIFSIQNFQGDARSADLYYYMHQQQYPQWDEYRRRLQEAAQKIVNQQPSQQSPSPETLAGSGTQSMANINAIAASTNAAMQAGNTVGNTGTTDSGSQAQQYGSPYNSSSNTQQLQPTVSTSVQGTVLTPDVSVPGLVDP
jgi:hypothetical protein